jgi:membrane-associated phospholipid phosphatase
MNRSGVLSTFLTHFWFKCLGTIAFTSVFFAAYIYLLRNPAAEVTIMPVTALDRLVEFEAAALPIYLSLWVYISLPPILMLTRREIVEYGLWIGALCLVALVVFYFWPSAVPAANIDWARYPGVAFLKGVDAAGNACPSLHVATAVFSCLWLHRQLPAAGLHDLRALNAIWCIAIVYSTMATKQHVAVDVVAGVTLALGFACFSQWRMLASRFSPARVARAPRP